jgi:hypothetical protein
VLLIFADPRIDYNSTLPITALTEDVNFQIDGYHLSGAAQPLDSVNAK